MTEIKINLELYEQAKLYVQERSEYELRAEIKEVYDQLLFESQKQKITPAQREEIEKISDLAGKIRVRGLAAAYYVGYLRNRLEDILKTGIFHPEEFKELSIKVKTALKT